MSYQQTQFHHPPRQIYLNSKFATLTQDSDKNSHCWFALQEPILIPRGYNNVLLSIEDAQIPISFYSISANNNTVMIRIDGVGTTVTIPVGNYDAASLGQLLQSSINNINSEFFVTITYNTNQNTYSFVPTITGSHTVTLAFPNLSYIVWGFSNSSTLYSLNTTLISTTSVDLAGSRFFFVQSPTFGTYNVNSKTGTTNQILCKIPITGHFFEIEQYRNITNFQNKISFRAMNISVIEMSILDEYLQPINFNGAHWSLTLSLIILGESPDDIRTAYTENNNLSVGSNDVPNS
jgi:hypothetical protein